MHAKPFHLAHQRHNVAHELQSISVLEEALRHASEPEQYFFVMLDGDLETISRFYDGM